MTAQCNVVKYHHLKKVKDRKKSSDSIRVTNLCESWLGEGLLRRGYAN